MAKQPNKPTSDDTSQEKAFYHKGYSLKVTETTKLPDTQTSTQGHGKYKTTGKATPPKGHNKADASIQKND